MSALMDKVEFRSALENAIKGREAKNASFSQAWADGKLERRHFARWAENHFHYVGPFADYLANIYSNTPDEFTNAKDFTLQNMYEEELADIRHTDLLIKFGEACGTTKERIEDPASMMPVTRGLQAWCYAMAMREHFVVATAAWWSASSLRCRRSTPSRSFRSARSTSFTEDEIEFFELHITSDVVTGSAATSWCWSTPTPPSCRSAA